MDLVMNIIARLVGGWSIIALLAQAAVKIPCGLALFALAGWIAWKAGDLLLADVFAAWVAYHGGRLTFGSLEGFVGGAPQSDLSTRKAQQRSRISGMR
jgi:hypothetical protein